MTGDAWQIRAACRNTDHEMWFPYKNRQHVETAKAICQKCPVPAPCATDAIRRGEEYGIWAGVWMERDDNTHDRLSEVVREGKGA